MIDSHCHLAGEEFADDAAEVVARARAAGLTGALCILDAADAAERTRADGLAAAWPDLRFSAGIHPHAAGAWGNRIEEAEAAVRAAVGERAATRAVGEVGLDYHYDFAPRPAQQAVFAAQLDLAASLGLSVVIHTREAEDDTLAILRGAGRVKGVLHCFTGSRDLARAALDLGLYISLAGIVTFPRADALREVAAFVPDDRLLVETDSPFLAPVPHRGKRNEPAWVRKVVDRLAEVRGVSSATLAERTDANYAALFRP